MEQNAAKNAGRFAGAVIIIQIITGFLINQVLVGPFTFAKDYLTAVAGHSNELTAGMLLGLLSGALSIAMAARVLPIFKQYNAVLAFAFLAFSILDFTNIAADNTSIQSLLAAGKQYVQSGVSPAGSYSTAAGTVAYEARLWTHLMTILIPAITALVFFYVLFMYRLVPRFIAVWGFTAAILMAIAIVLMIYGKVESILLLAPFGLNQLFLSIWLMVKGFKTRNGQGIQG